MSPAAKRSSAPLISIFLIASVGSFTIAQLDWPAVRWKLVGPEIAWPTIDRYDFHFDVSEAGRFTGRVRIDLSQVVGRRLTLLLNDELRVSEASAEGSAVQFSHYWRLPSQYHSEGRVVEFELPEAPSDGSVSLTLEYSGEAESGREGPDWRGILFVDTDEARMCEQTIFYPQVPLSLEGSAKAKAPYRMAVVAPREWELFVPAPGKVTEEDERTRTWSYRTEKARHPSLLGGLRERTDTVVNGARIVTLLRPEHASLAFDFVREASLAIDNYGERFGIIDSRVIGIVEILCRDSSYNWAAEGVMAFDRGALSGSVPVAKVAHEVAHMWWGQGVDATGAGERFLTEGLAEYSSWTYLEDADRSQEVHRNIIAARSAVGKLTENGDSRALSDVTFEGPDYETLAYDKGALVLRNVRAQLGDGQLDTALRRLVEIGGERQVDLDDFTLALKTASQRHDLLIPWIDEPGDIALRVENVRVDGGQLTATIFAKVTPANSTMHIDGTPIAMRIGGLGWNEHRSLTLEGEITKVQVDLERRELAFLHIDPEAAWTQPVENSFVVLNGGRLTEAIPRGGSTVQFGGTRLELSFDRALGPVTLKMLMKAQRAPTADGVSRFVLRDASLLAEGRKLVIETQSWLPNQQYQLSLTTLTDTHGLPIMPTPYELFIAPSTDEEPARIVSTVPEIGAKVVAPGGRIDLSLTFDEVMAPGYAITTSGVRDIERRGYRRPTLDGGPGWDESGRTINWRCVDLEVGQTYALPVRSRTFHDLSGNGCEPMDLIFTVVADD